MSTGHARMAPRGRIPAGSVRNGSAAEERSGIRPGRRSKGNGECAGSVRQPKDRGGRCGGAFPQRCSCTPDRGSDGRGAAHGAGRRRDVVRQVAGCVIRHRGVVRQVAGCVIRHRGVVRQVAGVMPPGSGCRRSGHPAACRPGGGSGPRGGDGGVLQPLQPSVFPQRPLQSGSGPQQPGPPQAATPAAPTCPAACRAAGRGVRVRGRARRRPCSGSGHRALRARGSPRERISGPRPRSREAPPCGYPAR